MRCLRARARLSREACLMRILVTRPEPDAQAQAETLAARGHEAVLAPLLIVETIPRVALGA